MNITIFTVQHDDPNWLNNIKVCVGQKQLDRHLRLIMEQRLEIVKHSLTPHDVGEFIAIRDLIGAGDIQGAWKIFTEGLGGEPVVKRSEDHYIVESHSVTIPGLSLLHEISRFALDGESQEPDPGIRALDTIVRHARIAINEIQTAEQHA